MELRAHTLVVTWRVECLEHDLCHLFTVSLGIQWSFGQEHWVFFRCNTKFVVERMMPDLLDIIPVGDDTVLDRVFQREDTTFRLSFVAHVRVFLTHTDHDGLMTGSTDDRWEHRSRCIITGKAGLAHT